jgi:hypothetical protein
MGGHRQRGQPSRDHLISILHRRVHPITAVGSAQISTAQSKFGGSSLLLNGTTDYVSNGGGSDFNFGTGDFTVDCWVYVPAVTGQRTIFSWHDSTNTNNWFNLITNSSLYQLRYGPSGNTIVSVGGAVAATFSRSLEPAESFTSSLMALCLAVVPTPFP